jgi:hypothetical protein
MAANKPKEQGHLSRREFLKISGGAAALGAMAALPSWMRPRTVEASPVSETLKNFGPVLGFYVPFHEIPNTANLEKFKRLVLQAGANAVVVDIKNEAGLINIIEFEHPLESTRHSAWAEDYAKFDDFLAWADKNNILVIGRQVVMEDARLVWAHPELGIHTKDGKVWTGGGRIWANLFDERVVEYNAAFAETAAKKGIKVIQFDYVRAPAEGKLKAIQHSEQNTMENRVAAINSFFQAAKPLVNRWGSLLMADFFGYTAYPGIHRDMGIGQLVEAAGPYLDIAAPMLYPGLFLDGLPEPACGPSKCTPPTLYPYEIVNLATRRTIEILAKVNPEAAVVPWIQAYPDPTFRQQMGLAQFEDQIRGAFEAGAAGVMAWLPSMKYHPEFYHEILEQLEQGK